MPGWRFYGATFTTASTPYFTDAPTNVEGNGVPFPFIQRSYEEHITAGCGTNPLVYCPNELVTRGQMASFIMRGLFNETMVLGPTDGADLGDSEHDGFDGWHADHGDDHGIQHELPNRRHGDGAERDAGCQQRDGELGDVDRRDADDERNDVPGPQALVVTSGGQNLTLPLAIQVGTY